MNLASRLVLASFAPAGRQLRFCSTISNIAKYRSDLFTLEQTQQLENVGRIDKIEVRYLGLPEDVTLVMNKNLSTPYNCAQHLGETHCKSSALALINGNIPWDMHRPLKESCTIQLLNFTVADPHIVNRAFWRTCSFMLGAALTECFKDEAALQLHSFPSPNVKSGSFVHDIVLSARDWKPTPKELRTFSAEMIKMAAKDLKIERLDVSYNLAMEMFKDNRYKTEQLPSISTQNSGQVTIYRVGHHVDISRGPMIGSTSLLGRCTVSAIHEIGDEGEKNSVYRVQGVALPVGIRINHFAYGILEDRSRKLNPARLPTEPFEESVTENAIA